MIDSTDWLLEKHFGKSLSDKDVDILDPATGTGTFIAELIDIFNAAIINSTYSTGFTSGYHQGASLTLNLEIRI